jgi:hypothetical protein
MLQSYGNLRWIKRGTILSAKGSERNLSRGLSKLNSSIHPESRSNEQPSGR